MDSDVTWASPSLVDDSISLYDLHKVNYTWTTTVTPAGYWSESDGLQYALKAYKYSQRTLQGIVLRAAIVVTTIPTDNLHERLVSHVDKNLDTLSKFNYAVHLLVREMYNFSWVLQPTNSWGYVLKNHTIDGMIGMLQREQVEIAISSANILKIRLDVVEFSYRTWKFRPCLIFRHPPTASQGNVLLKPFNTAAWLSIAAFLATVVVILRFISWAEEQYRLMSEVNINENSWSAAVIFAIGAITEQGTQVQSTWIAWHIVAVVSFVTGVFLSSYYSASIVSSLLAPPPKNIRTLRDLIDSPLQVGAENVSYIWDYFAHTTDPLRIELYHKKVFPPGRQQPAFYSISQGVYRMQHEKFAFHAEMATVYPLVEERFSEQDKCAITEILLFPATDSSAVPMQKRSPLKELMTYGMRKVAEHGLMERQFRIWKPGKPRCVDSGRVPVVEIPALMGAFVLLASGIASSLVILAMEKTYHLRSTKMTIAIDSPKHHLTPNEEEEQQLQHQQ